MLISCEVTLKSNVRVTVQILHFPLVSQPSFVEPANGTVAQLLTNNQVIVTQNFLTTYHKRLNDTFKMYVKTFTGSGQIIAVKIAGVVANSGMFAQAGNLLLSELLRPTGRFFQKMLMC
jgi:hypothetical protein